MSGKGRHRWIRQAAAWLVACALSLGVLPSLRTSFPAFASVDPFVAADICAAQHGGQDVAQDGKAAGQAHDCGQHCCLISVQSLPPAPVAVRPSSLAIAADPPYRASPAPQARPDPVHPARAPPFLAA